MRATEQILKDYKYLIRLRERDYFQFIKELQKVFIAEKEREDIINGNDGAIRKIQ